MSETFEAPIGHIYKAYDWFDPSIEKVDLYRETESSVWTDESGGRKGGKAVRRRSKVSTDVCYFHAWEDAKNWIVGRKRANVEIARRNLELANAKLGNVKGWKNPDKV